ncbi:hypothetical protein ANCDUO_14467, partial [Ancylostoma duodenale]
MYLQIKTSRASSLPWTTLQSMKWLLATLMIGDKLVLLFFILWRTFFGSQPVAVVNVAYPIVQSVAMLVGQVDFIQYVCYLAFYPLLLLQLLLNCFSDPSPFCNSKHFEYVKTHPETSASFVNRQILWWFGPLVSKASKDSLEIDDLFDLDEDLEADNLTALWETEWNKSVRDYEIRKRSQSANSNSFYTDEKTPLISTNGKGYGT